jgi:hypothetical protein
MGLAANDLETVAMLTIVVLMIVTLMIAIQMAET